MSPRPGMTCHFSSVPPREPVPQELPILGEVDWIRRSIKEGGKGKSNLIREGVVCKVMKWREGEKTIR